MQSVKKFKTAIVWVSLIVAFLVLYALVNFRQDGLRVPFTAFMRDVEENRIAQVQVEGSDIVAWRSDTGGKIRTRGALSSALVKMLSEHNISVTFGTESSNFQTILL